MNTLTQPQVDSSRHQSEEEDTTSTPTHVEHRASASTVVVKLERSRSLPSRTFLDSHDTIYDFPERSDVLSFQRRRKTAAKLTQFFGVDYRELISDVLESIENGMQVDRGDGLLGTEEFEVRISYFLRIETTLIIFVLSGSPSEITPSEV